MPIATIMSVLVLALVVEAAFGYSDRIYNWIGHPVTWLGALISTLDGALNRGHQSPGIRRAAGVLTLAVIVAIAAGIAWFIESALASHWAGNIVLAIASFDDAREPEPLLSRPGRSKRPRPRKVSP